MDTKLFKEFVAKCEQLNLNQEPTPTNIQSYIVEKEYTIRVAQRITAENEEDAKQTAQLNFYECLQKFNQDENVAVKAIIR